MNQNDAHFMPQFSSMDEAHLSQWAKKYFHPKLTEQGFVSYQDKGLSWYKVIDNSIIQTVYLFNGCSAALMPDLGFGCHPLFIPAPLPQKLTITGYGRDDVLMSIRSFPFPLVESPESMVIHSKLPQAGAELLDEIVFPHFSKIYTLDDAYQIHREYYMKKIEAFILKKPLADFNGMITCRDFIDEAIYMGDWDMLKYCEHDLDFLFCFNDRERKRVTEQRAAICDGKRDEFLLMLEKRKKRFVNRLEKKLGISISI